MRFLYKGKDGGPESTVDGFWLIEIKSIVTVMLLRFNPGSRKSYDSHAFNALTWFLRGDLMEAIFEPETGNGECRRYRRSFLPKFTPRDRLHRVTSRGTSWVFTIRGPWVDTWQEWFPRENRHVTLTHGRRVVSST